MRTTKNICTALLALASFTVASHAVGEPNYERALKRAQYLLNATIPTDDDFTAARSETAYRSAVRGFLSNDNFYDVMMRYHQRLLGIGLPTEYIDELMRDDIDRKANKFAQISCGTTDGKLRCAWASESDRSKVSSCPEAWEEPVSIFWYPGLVAFACPSVVRSCGNDLSRCFIEYADEDVAANSELGSTEAFDSRFSVIKSLSKQSAGLATAVVMANYPYTKILEPGLTAVDGAIAHFYRQQHHFDLKKLNLSADFLKLVDTISLTDTRFHLIYNGSTYEHGGIISTFGWLRRYEKNRTRANQLYQRLLCRQFTAELPKIFPQDPGNLRETPGCQGCHATLDPLADFFKVWGEGGELYTGQKAIVATSFGGSSGRYLADLANIIRNDNAFGTCTVEHAWEWLIGRPFHADEAPIRSVLTDYFLTTNFSFKELIYAIATHPNFVEGTRTNALVENTLSEPPLGEPPGGNQQAPCDTKIDYTADIAPRIDQCTTCHNNSNPLRQGLTPLTSEDEWWKAANEAIGMMSSGQMPPGTAGPPRIGPVFDLKEAVRCWVERNKQ